MVWNKTYFGIILQSDIQFPLYFIFKQFKHWSGPFPQHPCLSHSGEQVSLSAPKI